MSIQVIDVSFLLLRNRRKKRYIQPRSFNGQFQSVLIDCLFHDDCGQQNAVENLREYAIQHLSPHKVPANFTALETLPRNATGKVDRPLLRAGELQQLFAGGQR